MSEHRDYMASAIAECEGLPPVMGGAPTETDAQFVERIRGRRPTYYYLTDEYLLPVSPEEIARLCDLAQGKEGQR